MRLGVNNFGAFFIFFGAVFIFLQFGGFLPVGFVSGEYCLGFPGPLCVYPVAVILATAVVGIPKLIQLLRRRKR